MEFRAEVTGRLAGEKSCQGLLYAPLDSPLTYRSSHFYEFEFEGSGESAAGFVQKVLVDEVSQDVRFAGEPVCQGYCFCLEYGMKPSALDLEKESILAYHRKNRSEEFRILALRIFKRLYIFAREGEGASPEPFVKDIVNPAIHVWRVFSNAESST